MKKIIQNLEKQLEALQEHVRKRIDYKNFRSDSYLGTNLEAEHSEKTEAIKGQVIELQALIEELKELI